LDEGAVDARGRGELKGEGEKKKHHLMGLALSR